MARSARKISTIGCYHVVLRGNGKQIIFDDNDDRQQFVDILGECVAKSEIEVLAWCLMDNHVHLCLHSDPEMETEPMSSFMHDVQSRYAHHFNSKAHHVGHVFQGRFGSMAINDERYLLEAVRYIHDNPEKAGICSAAAYWWSSYHEYVGTAAIASTDMVLEALGGIEGFVEFSQSQVRGRYRFSTNRFVPDDEVDEVTRDVLGDVDPREIKAMPKEYRNELLARLRDAGLTIKQVERQTGLGTATIYRATRK